MYNFISVKYGNQQLNMDKRVYYKEFVVVVVDICGPVVGLFRIRCLYENMNPLPPIFPLLLKLTINVFPVEVIVLGIVVPQ